MDDVTHLEAKLQRAACHLRELETTGFQFLDGVSQLMLESSNPMVRSVVADPSTNSYLVTLTLPSPPVEISLALGDFLHNLRASLDYLARELVLAAGGQPLDGPGGTTFPVLLKAPARELDIRPGTWAGARRLLAEVQPYSDIEKRGNHHPLALIGELNNRDKHRLLNVTALSGAGGVAFVAPPASASVMTQEQRRHRIELVSGVPQRVFVDASEMIDPAEMAGSWAYTVVIDESGVSRRENLLSTPRRLFEYVCKEVIDRFLIEVQERTSRLE